MAHLTKWLRIALYASAALVIAYFVFNYGDELIPTGQPAPLSTQVHSYDGTTWPLSHFAGKILVVNFWASWCPPCMYELPELVQAAHNLKGKAVFVGLAIDSPAKDVAEVVKRFHVDYPVVWVDSHTLQHWGASSLPTTFVIDAQGKVAWTKQGPVTESELSVVIAAQDRK